MNQFAACPTCGHAGEPRVADVPRCADCATPLQPADRKANTMEDAKARNAATVRSYMTRLSERARRRF